MISTVTTSTITTVTTIAAMGLGLFIGIVAVAVLVIFLIAKELAGASRFPRFRVLGKHLNVGIMPLVIAFSVIVGTKIGESLA